ncbi:histidine phosphatase family protein [Candidatus Poribacteria bacterium]|nr:histidine phosphatase family protein [Candidatus Poribacteria bacterium]
MLLYLIRHGETDWNIERRCQGFTDSRLNGKGLHQAESIARHLSKTRLAAVYSSTLSRAFETARIIAKYHDAVVHATDDLRELNQGEFEGLTITELVTQHNDFLQRWFQNPADLKLPGGESLREMQMRAWSALERIVEKHSDGDVAVVGHNLCNSALLCQIMKLELADFRRIQQDVAAINVVEFGGRWPHPVVVRLNDTCHLQ